MRDLLEAIRDRLRAQLGTNLDANRVQITATGEGTPTTPQPPYVEVQDAGQTPIRYASRLQETVYHVRVLVHQKVLQREKLVLGSEGDDNKPRPATVTLAKQVQDLLNDWDPVDSLAVRLGFDVSAYLGTTETQVNDPERVAATQCSLTFDFTRFNTVTQPV